MKIRRCRHKMIDAVTPPRTSATREARGPEPSRNPIRRYLAVLGPGLVTGAADDDPSGITTYSVAGASLGYGMLWTAGFTFPLMACIQLVCARIGLVSGRGLAGALRGHYPRGLLYAACVLLLVANVFNIGADLSGMADAVEMLTGRSSPFFVVLFGVVSVVIAVYARYRTFARYVRWLTAVLLAYIAAAFLATPNWGSVLRATFLPSLRFDQDWMMTFVAILGTTISPYLFFWQASHEVEEEKAKGRTALAQREGATARELDDARLDVVSGMFFSNLVMYFIILTTASTLHRVGHTNIASSREAAEALRPLAGEAAAVLFALGIIGTGLLAIPILAGSASYAVAELFKWRTGLDLSPWAGRRFYLVFALAIAVGIAMDLFGMAPVRMLFLSAVLNGLLAPPLMALVMLVGNNRKVMGKHANGFWLNALGWSATAVMTCAAVALLLTGLR